MQLTSTDQNNFDFFQDLVENVDKIIFAYETQSNSFLYISPAFDKILPLFREIIKNPRNLLAKIHPDDQKYLKDNYRDLLKGDAKKDIEFRIVLFDGSERWFCVTSFLSKEKLDHTEVIIGYAEDITSRRDYDNILTKYSNKKNSILSIISHDLFGPLGSIKALSFIITKKAIIYKDKDLNKLIGLIDKLSTQSITLIKDLVKQEFLESAQANMVKQRVDIVQKIKEIIDLYKELQPEIKKNFKLITSSDEIYLEVDVTKFSQVINNLISNALKFTHEEAVITIEIEDADDHVLLKVKDDGIGIPQKFHENLFERFTEARRSGLNGEPSVGLGMSIIKTIIEWHKGKIWFESEENQGSTFFIKMPKIKK